MRVVIDARAMGWTGVGRYIRNLVQGLRQLNTPHEFLLAVAKEDQKLVAGMPHVVVDGSYYSWREQIVLGWKLRYIQADLWHFPHFNVPAWFDRPYVVTIHDTTRFLFPGQRQQGWWQQVMYERVFARAVRRARGVIAVSSATAEELRNLPLVCPPITVIPEAVADDIARPVTQEQRAAIRGRLQLSDPYLLFVGVWMSHKNIERLLQAFRVVRQQYPQLHLVITGQPRLGYVDVPALARRWGVAEAVRLPGFVEAAELPALYAEAAAFVFPSLYEGFGLPPLEAAAQGAPVVASNLSSIPEVMGKAAAYVNPEDVDSIVRGIQRVVGNTSYRSELRRLGREQVKRFSWEAVARQTLRVYEGLPAGR